MGSMKLNATLSVLGLFGAAGPLHALDNGVGLTPLLGWSTWNM